MKRMQAEQKNPTMRRFHIVGIKQEKEGGKSLPGASSLSEAANDASHLFSHWPSGNFVINNNRHYELTKQNSAAKNSSQDWLKQEVLHRTRHNEYIHRQ